MYRNSVVLTYALQLAGSSIVVFDADVSGTKVARMLNVFRIL